MLPLLRRARLFLALAAFAGRASIAGNMDAPDPTWRGINPDMLSGGLYAALVTENAARTPAGPARARSAFPDLAKGRPPAVLDARVGPNQRLGEDPAPLPAGQRGQAEAHLVRSTANPAVLLATFQDGRFSTGGGGLGCGYAVSVDGGLSWTRALIPRLTTASGGTYFRATDPVAAAGPDGDLYLNTLASIDQAFGRAAIVVSRSSDRGATWSDPVVIYQAPSTQISPDKNWLVANEFPSSATRGRLVCTWTNFTSNAAGARTGNNIVSSFSDDRGASWSLPVDVTPLGSSNQGSQPLFLPDGSLVVIYITFLNTNNVTQFSVQCRRSADGGRTFSSPAAVVTGFVNGWDDPEMREGIFLPSATVARQTGELFVTYTAVVNGSPRVVVTKSADRGATWTATVAASDQPAGVSVMNPAIAVTPDGQTVSVVFMDKRQAPEGRGFVEHYAALSFDGGATWQPNLRLTEMSSDIRYGTPTPTGVMLGDYLGVAPALTPDQPCVAIWCDTRSGDADPFVVRFAPAPAPDYGAWTVARGLRSSPALVDLAADDDGDGEGNYLEFIAGTDPRRAESGENLVIRRPAPGIIDVLWTERVDIQKLRFGDGVSITDAANLGARAPFGLSGSVTGNLPSDQYPTTPLPPGLAWHGARLSVAADSANAIARSFKYSAGIPVTASSLVATNNTDARLINLSTRGVVGAGSNQLIAGFVVDGRKSVLLRAAGPALVSLGVSGALADPRLALRVGGSLGQELAANDNWSQGAGRLPDFARLGAFPFAAGSLDAALAEQLPAASYTALVAGAGGATGVALVEAYDADAAPGRPGGPRFTNLSTRGWAAAGDDALVAGFVISGEQPRRVLLRAIGPTLAILGVEGSLTDPSLTIYRGATPLASNDDWELSRSAVAIAATAQRVGAFPLNSGSLDAAILLTLAPGPYTAIVSSTDGRAGIALVEVYDAD